MGGFDDSPSLSHLLPQLRKMRRIQINPFILNRHNLGLVLFELLEHPQPFFLQNHFLRLLLFQKSLLLSVHVVFRVLFVVPRDL